MRGNAVKLAIFLSLFILLGCGNITDLGSSGGVQVPDKVTGPQPKRNTQNVSISTALSWQPAEHAITYRVYFGSTMSLAAVISGTTWDPPGELAYGTIYEWRVDSVNAAGITTGDTWRFRTEYGPQPPTAGFTVDTTTGAAPFSVNFTDTSTGLVTSWAWDFNGDGNTDSTIQNPSCTYYSPGTFTVSLIATGPGGTDVETKTSYITVLATLPSADFSADPLAGPAPLTVAFTDLSTGTITGWNWDFDNNGTVDSTVQNPTHQYSSEGTYSVKLTIDTPAGPFVRTRTDYITVSSAPPPAPVAMFSATPASGLTPLIVSFTDESTGSITDWEWDFDYDGSFTADSTIQNPTHLYNSPGTYSVALRVTGPGGSDTFVRSSYITTTSPPSPPVAGFSGTPTSGTVPLEVDFTDESTGIIDSWLWSFGDGTTSIEQNPSHTYTSAGTYTVGLTVTNTGGSNGDVKLNYITVTEVAPVAGFSGTPTSGNAPLLVSFTDESTGSVSSWLWSFGDGTTSISQNPSHSYGSAGAYTVTLAVNGPGGSDIETKNDYITVSPSTAPVADFVGDPLTGNAPLLVTFTDLTSGSVDTWAWDFDGFGVDSTAQNPTFLFSTPGTYTVKLTVSGPQGSDFETKTNYITVNWPPPVADFIADPSSGLKPLVVTFTDASTGNVTSWEWDFDNDTIADAFTQNATHIFDTIGDHTVTLTVTGPGGTDSFSDTIHVTALPVVTAITPAPEEVLSSEPSEIFVTFSKEIDASTVNSTNFTLLASGGDGTFDDGNEIPVSLWAVTQTATNIVKMDLFGASLPDDAYLVTVHGIASGNWSSPVNVTELNTSSDDFMGSVSHNGLTLYLHSNRSGGAGGTDIWKSTRSEINATWETPVIVSELSTTAWDGDPFLSDDGLTLWFASDRSGGYGYHDIWVSTRTILTANWGTPSHVPSVNCSYNDDRPSVSPDGLTIWFASDKFPDTGGGWDVWVATRPDKSSSWEGRTSVSEIKVSREEYAPWVSPDQLTMYYSSDREGGLGAYDVWKVTRQDKSSQWGNATNVSEINSTENDYRVWLSWHASTLWFSSNRSGGLGGSDIWKIERAGPVTDISGYALDGEFSGTFPSGNDIEGGDFNSKFYIGDMPVASFTATPTEGTEPLSVAFTDSSSGMINAWEWDFDNDGTVDSTVQHPTHIYDTPGLYSVKLSVSGPVGTNSTTKTGYISVYSTLSDVIYVSDESGSDSNDGLTWPTAVKSIQEGLNKATAGWTVLVADGTYTGTSNRNLDFGGKSMHLLSCGGTTNCIIDCQEAGRGFYFHSGETDSSIVEGFTIQNGNVVNDYGGGVYCVAASPTIRKCIVTGCRVDFYSGYGAGGGIMLNNSSAIITACIITENWAKDEGGGISCTNSTPLIVNCLISKNTSTYVGGGIQCYDHSDAIITNCTIVENNANYGGALDSYNSDPVLSNTILWGNQAGGTGNQIWAYDSGSLVMLNNCDYSNVGGDVGGNGSVTPSNCITLNPQFVDAGNQNYCLSESSPCIHNGNNLLVPGGVTTELDGNARIVHVTVDMGAYENQTIGSWRQKHPSNNPPLRNAHAMAYDSARGVTVLFGGLSGSSDLNDTWEWNGTDWTQRLPSNNPPARGHHAMVFDSARGVTVLFGGDSNGSWTGRNDTWEWNGSDWTQKFPTNIPPLRYVHSMAYNSTAGVTVLFGGCYGAGSYRNDTWEWNGTDWTEKFPANSPSVRNAHSLVYDSVRDVTMTFGGYGGSWLNETWEYNGTNWTQRYPANSSSARAVYGMTYDSARNATVLFGGWNGSNFDDTWEYNGTDWVQINPVNKPTARFLHSMAYDSDRGVMVLFGGRNGSTNFNDTWEY